MDCKCEICANFESDPHKMIMRRSKREWVAAGKPVKNVKLIEVVLGGLPYPEQVKDIDLTSEEYAARFTWRGTRYRVSSYINVEEIGEGVLIGSDKATLMRTILERYIHRDRRIKP